MSTLSTPHPLIFGILQGLLRKGETVRVDLEHAGGRRSGILVAIDAVEWPAAQPIQFRYRITYEFNFDVHDVSVFTHEELEHCAFIKQTAPTIWELKINHAKKTESYGLGPI
jgi:hypothetical protein